MIKDFWNQEIQSGDFVISASKSSGTMVMGVMKDAAKQTRIRVDWNYRTKKWEADEKAHHMYTMGRTLKLTDDYLAQHNPELFDVMNDVREALKLKTTRGLKTKLQTSDQLKKILESVMK